MIEGDIERTWTRDELCSSEDSIFIGTGVCNGRTKGVEKTNEGVFKVHSEIIDVINKEHKFITSERII